MFECTFNLNSSPAISARRIALRLRVGFTLIELLVVIAIISLLLAILLPALEHVRHQSYITKCASNLRQIGQALTLYAGENHASFPRTKYLPGAPLAMGTGATAADAFTAGGVSDNDVTASAFLLLVTQRLPAEIFVCLYNDEPVTKLTPLPDPDAATFQTTRKTWRIASQTPIRRLLPWTVDIH